MKNIVGKLSLVAIVTSSIFFINFNAAPSLADEANALECVLEKNLEMQFVICRTHSDRLAKNKEFTNEYSFLMMNVIANRTLKFSRDEKISKELLRATLVSMIDVLRKEDENFLNNSYDYLKKLGPAAEGMFNAEMQLLTKVMQSK